MDHEKRNDFKTLEHAKTPSAGYRGPKQLGKTPFFLASSMETHRSMPLLWTRMISCWRLLE